MKVGGSFFIPSSSCNYIIGATMKPNCETGRTIMTFMSPVSIPIHIYTDGISYLLCNLQGPNVPHGLLLSDFSK